MKCPTCAAAGETSKVFVNGATKTLLGWVPFYDEDGEYHAHDPNRVTEFYGCSNGHGWSLHRVEPCPAGDYPVNP